MPVPRNAKSGPAATNPGQPPKGAGNERDMGSALRRVYQNAVDEAIPTEMLDLLGKLD